MSKFNTVTVDENGTIVYPLSTSNITLLNKNINITSDNISAIGNVNFTGGYINSGDYYYDDGLHQNGSKGWYIWHHEIYKDYENEKFLDENEKFLDDDDIIKISSFKIRYFPGKVNEFKDIQLNYGAIKNMPPYLSNKGIVIRADRERKTTGGYKYTLSAITTEASSTIQTIVLETNTDNDKVNWKSAATPASDYYKCLNCNNGINYTYNDLIDDSNTRKNNLQTGVVGTFNPYNNINKVVYDDGELAKYQYAKLWLSDKQPPTCSEEIDTRPSSNLQLFDILDKYGPISSIGKLSLIQTTHYTDKFNLISYDNTDGTMIVQLDNSIYYDNNKLCSNINALNLEVIKGHDHPRPYDRSIRVTDKSLGVVELFPVTYAIGYANKAMGGAAHAEGKGTKVYDDYAHAEGVGTEARSYASHAEGRDTKAYGYQSHAEGYQTSALNSTSHSEGYGTVAYGAGSHAEGYFTTADNDYQLTIGMYNNNDDGNYAFVIGNGTESNHSNALTVDWDGNVNIAKSISAETVNTNGLSVGNVTLSNRNINAISYINYNNTDHTISFGSTNSNNMRIKFGNSGTVGGNYSIVHGNSCSALASFAVAHGDSCNVAHIFAEAHGAGLQTTNSYQFIVGKHNDPNTSQDARFVVGGGDGTASTINALEVHRGKTIINGSLTIGNNGVLKIGNTELTEDHLKKLVDAIKNGKI